MSARDEASRRRVRKLLARQKWADASAASVARKAGVSWGLAADEIAKARGGKASLRSYVTKWGTRATMDTGNIGRHRAENAAVKVPLQALRRALAHLPAAERLLLLKALSERDRRRVAATDLA
jgi:hypothetical protein